VLTAGLTVALTADLAVAHAAHGRARDGTRRRAALAVTAAAHDGTRRHATLAVTAAAREGMVGSVHMQGEGIAWQGSCGAWGRQR
jgi:hypothetical protein